MKEIIILTCIAIAYILGKETSRTDLEIYTRDNIIYINGLTITNEADTNKIVFKSKEELREYISTLTANQWNQY